MAVTNRISAQLVADHLGALVSWPTERVEAEVVRFIGRQPAVKEYVLATVGSSGPEVVGFVLHMALAIDNVYRGVCDRAPRRISERLMDAAAAQVETSFAQLVGVEPALALRRLLFQRDLAEPELLVELMRVLMAASDDEPDLERALGIAFVAIKAIALAYERGNGLAAAVEMKGSLAQVFEAQLGRPLKIGRNEPCPCRSGKPFKRCCGQSEPAAAEAASPCVRRLGDTDIERRFERYRALVKETMRYGGAIDPGDAAWLAQQRSALEQRYHPGRPGGVPEPLVCTYLLYDLQLPAAGKTVGELLLERDALRWTEPERALLRHLCESYVGFYALIERNAAAGTKTVRELGTDTAWIVGDVEDPTAAAGIPGEVWLCRLAGPSTDAVTIMAPLVYPRQARECLESFVHLSLHDGRAAGGARADVLRDTMKRGVPLLAEYLVASDYAPECG